MSLCILGSTGSIGCNTIAVAQHLGLTIDCLTAFRSVDALADQARQVQARQVVLADPAGEAALRAKLKDLPTEIRVGPAALAEVAADPASDTVVTAVVGAAGLPATVSAVQAGKRVAIANKEPLVMAGQLITDLARQHDATLLPIDSEHSAIFQCLGQHHGAEVAELIITGSGGPFRTVDDLASVTVDQALNHPTWDMGPKITIDSATLMNKALEIIEARWLFDMPVERIRLLIHPQSVVHSMVSFADGSVVAQLGQPDMRTPIQYALTHPRHVAGPVPAPDFTALGGLHFEAPQRDRFPSVDLGYQAAAQGGLAPTIMNAANEIAVEAFLNQQLPFINIMPVVAQSLEQVANQQHPSLDHIIACDAETRRYVSERLLS